MKDKFTNIWGDLSKRVGVTTIQECSKDEDIYLVNSTVEAIKFDCDGNSIGKNVIDVLMLDWFNEWKKKKWHKNIPRGVDCLYVKDETLFLVEFKNQAKVDYVEIKGKIYDTLALLSFFYSLDRSEFSDIEILIVKKFSRNEEMELIINRKTKKPRRISTHLDFLQKIYQTKITVLSPIEYEALIRDIPVGTQ